MKISEKSQVNTKWKSSSKKLKKIFSIKCEEDDGGIEGKFRKNRLVRQTE